MPRDGLHEFAQSGSEDARDLNGPRCIFDGLWEETPAAEPDADIHPPGIADPTQLCVVCFGIMRHPRIVSSGTCGESHPRGLR